MDETATDAAAELDPATGSVDSRRWMRDLGALLALPALWVDHEPVEIAEGLLSVLFGVLPIDAGFARFDDPRGASALETWRPSGPQVPAQLVDAVSDEGRALDEHRSAAGIRTAQVRQHDGRVIRITTLPLTLPWEHAYVVVSSPQPAFPTERDAHLLRVAVSQAAIAIHTARRIAREHAARLEAERGLDEHRRTLDGVVAALGPELAALSGRVDETARWIAARDDERGAMPEEARAPALALGSADPAGHVSPPQTAALTRRETEVLGLLAQGLSNKEIAGVMWISDRTIERHVTSVYRKIGVARRSEATAFALRHGLA